MEEGGNQTRKETQEEAGKVWIPGNKILSIIGDVRLGGFVIHTTEGLYQADTIEEVEDPKQGKKGYSFRPVSFTPDPLSRDPSVAKQEG